MDISTNKAADTAILTQLIHKSLYDVTNRTVQIELAQKAVPIQNMADPCSIVLRVTGDYSASLAMSAESSFLLEITRRMKYSNSVTHGDVIICASEYYNMVCGYLISHLNNKLHLRARFGIPAFIKGNCIENLPSREQSADFSYTSEFGSLRFFASGLPDMEEYSTIR